MPTPNITFIKQQGRTGRTIPGQDYISALLFYCPDSALPSGFSPSLRIKQFLTLTDAEAAGITNDYRDETQATATFTPTAIGNNGDIVTISVQEPTKTTVLCTYTKAATEPTVEAIAAAITGLINSGTNSHGYKATVSGSAVTITAKKGLGIYLNNGNRLITSIPSGEGFAASIGQFSGGAAGMLAAYYYQISEFFRMQKGSNGSDGLYVGFYATPSTYTFSPISAMQTFANGKIRQIGIWKDGLYNSGDLTLISNVCKTNDDLKRNISALYAADMSGIIDISTIDDLSLLTANKASSVIGQDGAALGNFLFKTTGKSIPVLGAALGALSLSSVSEDFGQPIDKFNISAGGGYECDIPAFANGQLLSAVSDAALSSLDSKRHIYLIKYIGFSGSYFNDNHTSISLSSDYAFINDNRVIDKAIRGIYIAVLPLLKGKLYLNSDGTLRDTTVATFQNACLQPLFQMEREGDLSDVANADVYINPTQNVKQANTILINVNLNEDGIARQIQIPIGFKSN